MVSKIKFDSVDGVTSRFLSDFIIQSEQFARVYNYFYNAAGVEGDIDPTTGLPTRVLDIPNPAEDLVTLDKWDLVDNSILFYTDPVITSSVWIEVATTPEEFGETLVAPSVERSETAADNAEASAAAALLSEINSAASETAAALSETNAAASEIAADADATQTALDRIATNADVVSTNADVVSTNADVVLTGLDVISTGNDVTSTNADVVTTNANVTSTQLLEWEAEAEKLTATSYAIEAEDVPVNLVTSDGDGTFTYTPQAGIFSSFHYSIKAGTFNPALYALLAGDTAQDFSADKLTATTGVLFGTDTLPANTLDDYEEGTWTPSTTGVTGTVTSTSGTYTKVGNIVTVHWKIIGTGGISVPSSAGTPRIDNLPFTPSNNSSGTMGQNNYDMGFRSVTFIHGAGWVLFPIFASTTVEISGTATYLTS